MPCAAWRNTSRRALQPAWKRRLPKIRILKWCLREPRGAYTLELAIISITPTNARAGIFVTALSGIKGGGLVKRFIKKGHIAMAGRLRDESGRIVSEFADYEEDHSSLLGVDTKDFRKYAHHQRTIDEWAREITDVYSSTYGHWTQKRMICLNPF